MKIFGKRPFEEEETKEKEIVIEVKESDKTEE